MGVSFDDREDGVSVGGAYTVLTIGTTPVELKVGATALSGRIGLLIRSLSNTIYLGFDNSVTSATGFPLLKNEVSSLSANNAVWAVASGPSRQVAIMEFSGAEFI